MSHPCNIHGPFTKTCQGKSGFTKLIKVKQTVLNAFMNDTWPEHCFYVCVSVWPPCGAGGSLSSACLGRIARHCGVLRFGRCETVCCAHWFPRTCSSGWRLELSCLIPPGTTTSPTRPHPPSYQSVMSNTHFIKLLIVITITTFIDNERYQYILNLTHVSFTKNNFYIHKEACSCFI
jgi:hypothetical protein